MRRCLHLTPFDGLLLLMVLIWGANYSVVKAALTRDPAAGVQRPAADASRRPCSWRRSPATGVPAHRPRATGWRLAALGAVGHFVYQVCFMAGLARTTASNSSLIIGCSPVAVSLASALAGHERVPRAQWTGVLLSVAGIYLVVGTGRRLRRQHRSSATSSRWAPSRCWAVYTVGVRGRC